MRTLAALALALVALPVHATRSPAAWSAGAPVDAGLRQVVRRLAVRGAPGWLKGAQLVSVERSGEPGPTGSRQARAVDPVTGAVLGELRESWSSTPNAFGGHTRVHAMALFVTEAPPDPVALSR